MKTPGDRVREFRKQMGLTQTEFGKYFGHPKNWIATKENGKIRITVDFLMVLYENFKLSPSWVLLGVEPQILNEKKSLDTDSEFRYIGDASF
jgi:transcriptional regulator with XRE-family HTH domain